MKPALHVVGMHGLGDGLHQRAIIRALAPEREVWLETPWPSLYHDFDIHLLSKGSRLRTQAKNAERESAKFERNDPPPDAELMNVWYQPGDVRAAGSVLAAMCQNCRVPTGDFRLPIPREWMTQSGNVATLFQRKPLLIYRPLMERTEWSGCRNRNPDRDHYRDILNELREDFHVVSIGDFVDGVEWITSHDYTADTAFHRGELTFETMAVLFSEASLVLSAPGFAIPLAQAVGTPSIVVVGGYEDGTSFAAGARYTDTLVIEPIKPCPCWSHHHECDKRIDMSSALQRVRSFASAALAQHQPVAA